MELQDHRPRVLFVDDEPDVTRSLRVALRKEPWRIFTASSAAEALEMFEADPFDAVVSDERMPGMAGSAFLTRVKEGWPDTIRILLSGHASLESAVAAVNDAGIHRFLLKPSSPEEIAVTLNHLLEVRAEELEAQALLGRPRQGLEETFDAALEGLWMGFQPILGADGSLFAHEALMRTASIAISSPPAMLAAAEELGRSRELGRIVRSRVAERIDEAPPNSKVFVNLDVGDLQDPDVVDPKAPLSLRAERVVLEITERSPLEGIDLPRLMSELRALGFSVALDDMGAGYAGLGSLTKLLPDFVKFDMELVRGIDCAPTKRAILTAMAGLCHQLGIRTIAEGIERSAERDVVVELGCDFLQGYLFATPQRSFYSGDAFERAA